MQKLVAVERPKQGEIHDLTTEEIDLVVNKLYQISRETTLDFAIRVGSLIIHYFYSGNITVWRQRGPKTTSFRRLADHPGLPMSASTLYRCVAIYELCERLGVVDKWRRVTVSHLRLVLRLPEVDQRRLLSAANAERWSVQRLEDEVRRSQVDAGGQEPAPPRQVRRYTRLVDGIMRAGSTLLAELPKARPLLLEKYPDVVDAIQCSIENLALAREILNQS